MALSIADEGHVPFGRYRLLERLGAGGMAVVYRARSEGAGGQSRELVIKRVLPELSRDPRFSSMLVAEARISSRLRHPNIVQLYELGRVGDEFYLAMELVDGVDLVHVLNGCVQARRPLPIGLGCYVAVELARALAYAHDLRDTEGRSLAIVHRDVTPSNVMLTRAGGVKLLDFGVAKAAEHVRDDRTRTGTLKGKVNYLSPESADGRPVDRRSDIFALGIVLHECLTLKRLFKAEGDLLTLRLIREANVAPPSQLRPEVTPALDRVVMKMLARDPDARYADCQQLLDELAPIAAELGGDAAGLAQLVEAMPPAQTIERDPVDDMDAGPTPAIEIESLVSAPDLAVVLAPASDPAPAPGAAAPPAPGESAPSGAAAPSRPAAWSMWKWPLVAAFVSALTIALVAGRSHKATLPAPLPALVSAPARAAAPVHAAAPAPPGPSAAAPAADRAAPPAIAPAPDRAAPAATVVIDTDVPAARITLDGAVVADRVRRARIRVARPGEHQIEITALRRRPFTRTLTLAAGATVELRVTLERSRAHATKHGSGENYLVNPFGK